MGELYDWTQDAQKVGDIGGAHWLGDVEVSDLPARFMLLPVEDTAKTERLGRPVYEDKLHIEVLQPGGDRMIRRFQEADKFKWPRAWEAWERDQSAPKEGTPLEEWPQITPAAIATLKAANVFTVENLLMLSDAHLEKIGAVAKMYQDKAKDYMARAEGQNVELEEVKAQNEALQEQLKVMEAAIKELQKPKRRGRPRKTTPKVKHEPVADNPGRDGPVGAAET